MLVLYGASPGGGGGSQSYQNPVSVQTSLPGTQRKRVGGGPISTCPVHSSHEFSEYEKVWVGSLCQCVSVFVPPCDLVSQYLSVSSFISGPLCLSSYSVPVSTSSLHNSLPSQPTVPTPPLVPLGVQIDTLRFTTLHRNPSADAEIPRVWWGTAFPLEGTRKSRPVPTTPRPSPGPHHGRGRSRPGRRLVVLSMLPLPLSLLPDFAFLKRPRVRAKEGNFPRRQYENGGAESSVSTSPTLTRIHTNVNTECMVAYTH